MTQKSGKKSDNKTEIRQEDLSLLKKSAMAMDAVKTQGRNNYMFFSNIIR
ncbi:MAG: hypothetical protein WA096_12765 [Smithella sp.]